MTPAALTLVHLWIKKHDRAANDRYKYKSDSTKTYHFLAESLRRGHNNRSHHIGDPAFYDVPIDELLSKNKFLVGEKISGVDFMLGHSLYMANQLGCIKDDMININRYLKLINNLDSFQKAINA